MPEDPTRFIGLDVHKHYCVAVGVDADLEVVLPQKRIPIHRLEGWAKKHLTTEDAVVLEVTTNAWQIHDELLPHVHSVTVAHPPHIALVTRAAVKTDQKAAHNLAKLHAAGLVEAVWVPPQEVRELRALLAQRTKLVRLQTQCKNRLHAVLHRLNIVPPKGGLFKAERLDWWGELPLSPLEASIVRADLKTLLFAREQTKGLEETLKACAAQDERMPFIVQLPGFRYLNALTVLAAIGKIERFASDRKLSGYAGLGARLHHSGQTHKSGGITKTGRKDLRTAMVQAAHAAVKSNLFWKGELKRLEPRLGYQKAIVAIARRLLVTVWHVLTKREADKHAQPVQLARKLLQHSYDLGRTNRLNGQTGPKQVRQMLNLLGTGEELTHIAWGNKVNVPLPPSEAVEPG